MPKNLPSPRAELDLASGSLFYVDSKGRRTSMRVRGIEGAEVYARTARITGGAGPDALITWGCDMVIDARAGNDNVGMFIERECGAGTRRTLYGGPGDDRLTGSALSDRLLGGPGDDHAHGGDGDDVCVAERVTACERCSPTGDPASFPLISLAGSRDQHPGHLRGRVDRQSVAATATSRSSAD
jgi:hypothetical protein